MINTAASLNLSLLHAAFERPSLPEAFSHTLSFKAADDRALSGQLYRPPHDARGAVLIGGATAVPQRFYARYAQWLATQGLTVLSFDSRGTGTCGGSPRA